MDETRPLPPSPRPRKHAVLLIGLSALDRPQRRWTIKPSVNLTPIVAAQKTLTGAGIEAAIRAVQLIALGHGLAKVLRLALFVLIESL